MKAANPTETLVEAQPGADRIGRMLVEEGLITADQLDEALAHQQERPDHRLGEALIQKKFIQDKEFYPVLARQLGLPYIDEVDPKGFDENVVGRININFAKRFKTLPLAFEGRGLRVLTSEPLSFEPLDDIAGVFGRPVLPAVSPPGFLLDTTNYIYDRAATLIGGEVENVDEEEDELNAAEHGLEEITDLLDADDEAPIIRYVNQLLYQAVKERASDIHIEPHEKELVVRIRVDGILYLKGHPQKRFQNAIVSRVKVMANLNIAEKRLPQDGRIRIKIAGRDIDIRVSTLPAQYGEKVVMRLLDKTNILMDLEDIGIREDKVATIGKLIKKTHGIILVTGPTGSGKTTTLYACLNKINHPEINITTVEDPVEYQLKGISQTQVNEKIDLTFASGLRSILRQDPDVIMVGEIRDPETAEMAIQASLTGHLVFSTLHTNDSAGAIARLIDMNTEPFLISSTVIAIVAQRLVRTICPDCAEGYSPSDLELEELGLKRAALKDGKVQRGKGCASCGGNGYRGRSGIYEILLVDEAIQKLIMNRASSNELKKVAMQRGMLTLRQDGAEKVISGITTIEEVLRVTQEESFEVL